MAVGVALKSDRNIKTIRKLVPDAAALRELYEFAVEHGVDEGDLSSIDGIERSDLDSPRLGLIARATQKILERLDARL